MWLVIRSDAVIRFPGDALHAASADASQNRDAFPQQVRRMSGTFDLPPRRVGHACRAQKMALSGSEGQRLSIVLQPRVDDGIARDHPFRTSRATKTSARSKSGYSQADPFNQN